jgi:hypothetical protein
MSGPSDTAHTTAKMYGQLYMVPPILGLRAAESQDQQSMAYHAAERERSSCWHALSNKAREERKRKWD